MKNDLISREEAIEYLMTNMAWYDEDGYESDDDYKRECITELINGVPSAQPNLQPTCNQLATDCISRQAAINAVYESSIGRQMIKGHKDLITILKGLPSAQPERRCVNCGRTVNNGGWYEDGRTRCPIEEHYALPKDGYCHLWEKRKDWEDDYVKRAEEGENRWTTR